MHGGRILRLSGLVGSCLIAVALSVVGVAVPAAAAAPGLDHVFLIVEENNGFHDVIGNRAAPNLTYLARTFGVETHYFGVSPCCSEPNYVGLLGGSAFNVNSDDAYWKNVVNAPSLISQLDQAATLTFAEHYNGRKWTVVRTPNTGPNFNSFYGVAASGGHAWAVGDRLNSKYQARALIETWNGKTWSIAHNPQPGSVRDMLFGASALSPSDVWVVGDQEGGDGLFETLAEHWDGGKWTVVPTPDPGSTGNHLYAVDAVGPDDVWAAGQQLGGQVPDQGLVEHWDGHSWSVVDLPVS
jgi:hypothetical protein